MFTAQPDGDAEQTGGYTRLAFGEEVCTGDLHLKVVSILMVVKPMSMDEITGMREGPLQD